MRMIFAVTMTILVATAGCLQLEDGGGDLTTDGPPADDGNQTYEAPSDGNQTDDGHDTSEPAPNAPPTADLAADATNGSAPLTVNFTLDGSDDDGDELSWTLDLGDGNDTDGVGLPATVAHNFAISGNYTVVLQVTDGTDTATANVTITVEADTGIAYCHRPDAIAVGDYWLDDRGDPIGTGLITGDGTWVYEESNGVEGLQVGGDAEIDKYVDCSDPDTLIF